MHVVIFVAKMIFFTFPICGGKDSIYYKKQDGISRAQNRNTYGGSNQISKSFGSNIVIT